MMGTPDDDADGYGGDGFGGGGADNFNMGDDDFGPPGGGSFGPPGDFHGMGSYDMGGADGGYDGMGGYGGNEGTEQQLPRKHKKEREAGRSVIGPSGPLGADKGLGIFDIHGRVAFKAQWNDEKIESLKKDRRGQEDGLVTLGKGGA